MSVKPKVSIIIPVYNTEKYVYRALESVRSQRYENIEAIVINDGASDSSGEIAERFCHEDERFIYLEQENGGASSARNNGLTKVTGKYVTFLDSDDTMPDDAIMNMVTYAEKSKAHLVIGEIQYISFIGKRTSLKFAEKLSQKENIDILDVDITYNLKVNNKLFRADIIINNKLIFENFAIDEDAVFLYDYLLFCNTAAGCPHITYNYYQQNLYDAGSLSNSTDKRSIASMFDATDAVIEKAYKLLEGEGYSRQDKTAIRYINILVTRFIYLEIIGTYRRIWNSEEILDLLNNKLNDYKKSFQSMRGIRS